MRLCASVTAHRWVFSLDCEPMEDSPLSAIQSRVQEFRQALVIENDNRAIVERFLFHGQCYAISEDSHFTIKQRIAQEFGIDVSTDLFVVGSAKLGFSISPSQRWKHFDDESDVDVAIISHELYQTVWHEVYDYSNSGADWPNKERFQKYLFRGWIRPDYLPTGPTFQFVEQWWEFFRALKAEEIAGPYKIAGALYHDIEFLRKYHANAVAACRAIGEEDAD